MKKPIEEIMEKASKGSYRVKQETEIYSDGYFVASVLSCSGGHKPQDHANAQLIAHWLINGPKMLEALNELIYPHSNKRLNPEYAKELAKKVIEDASFVELANDNYREVSE